MEFLKEYKWWLIFLLILSCGIFILSNNPRLHGKKALVENLGQREGKIINAVEYFLSIVSNGDDVYVEPGAYRGSMINLKDGSLIK